MSTRSHSPPTGQAADSPASEACRDVEAALAPFDEVEPAAVRRAAVDRGPSTAAVPATHEMTVLQVVGLDCGFCEALVEATVGALDGVSNVSACHRTGTTRIDYDPGIDPVSAADRRLTELGYPVRSRDEAFAERRKRQWTDARFATGVLAGSMVLLPYVAVVYPSRIQGLFYTPAGGQHLADLLASPAGTQFYLNLAVLTGIVLLFTGKPILDRAVAGLRRGTPTPDLAVAAAAVGVYAYSTLVAFAGVGGDVYYDVALALVMATTVARRVGLTAAEPSGTPAGVASDSGEESTTEIPPSKERPPAVTDGGRERE